MSNKTFLVEIGTEELPPKALRSLAEAFAAQFAKALDNAALAYQHIHWYATPRRLALKVSELAAAQADKTLEKRGPALAQAFDASGHPTQAALAWAHSCGIRPEDAGRLVTDKGEWLLYQTQITGAAAETLLPDLVAQALAKLPVPKLMRWGNSDIQFVRPVHNLVMLLDNDIVAGCVLGIQAGRHTFGHRFMGESRIALQHAADYPDQLQQRGKVMADYPARREYIRQQAQQVAQRTGGRPDLNDSLLEEVTALVEWPVVMSASFDEKFLAVPAEALVHTMKGDQKYFPVYDDNGRLLPQFIFVANIESTDPQQVIAGNEKVVRPRLADAEFFFHSDRKQRLEQRLPRLASVLFQQQLGSLRDKTDRLVALSGWIAGQTGADVALARRAGLLAKCDLLTSMVFEFTDTQGIMGMHYARLDGEDEAVALALNQQYQPRFAGDSLPDGGVACALAIADKIDTLAGIFGIGQHPKGDKDPFALRRAAIGILRIIIEKRLPLDLQPLTQQAVSLYADKLTQPQVTEQVIDFMLARLRAWYQEQGYQPDTVQAVLSRRPTRPADADARIRAVAHFRSLEAASALAAANKRVCNILAKAGDPAPQPLDSSQLPQPEEQHLAQELERLSASLQPLFDRADYQQALTVLATLREPVDAFFEQVMVMTDDDQLRARRLALLSRLRELFLHVADISLLQ